MFMKISDVKTASIVIKDKFGNPAAVDGAPAWAVSDPALATLEVATDGMSAKIMPVGVIGSFKLQVSADADLGEGVKTILGEMDIDLLAGEAEVIEISIA